MNLHSLLRQRHEAGRPVRVGLIGAGKFGTMFLSQVQSLPGMQLVGVADLTESRAADALTRAAWSDEVVRVANSSGEVMDHAARGQVSIITDPQQLIAAELDVVVECTGHPEAGTRHALAAFEASCHVVMVTVEADVLVGPALRAKADDANVAISFAYGDQPALVCELVDWARTCGFEVVAAGKGTKHLPEYHYSTPETAFDYYGFSDEQRAAGDFNPKMFNSFLDGTKSAIEMAAIANATGLIPQPDGLQFGAFGTSELAEKLKPRSAGGTLHHSGTVEVVSCLHPDGRPVANDLRWGVYVTFRAPNDYTRRCFQEYGITTDTTGEFGALYRPSHLIGLELPISVASVALRGVPTGTTSHFVGDVGAVAKRDLQPGDALDGEGGTTVYGRLLPAEVSVAQRALPIGLASGVKLIRSVSRDAVLTYDDVVAGDSLLWAMRAEVERGLG